MAGLSCCKIRYDEKSAIKIWSVISLDLPRAHTSSDMRQGFAARRQGGLPYGLAGDGSLATGRWRQAG